MAILRGKCPPGVFCVTPGLLVAVAGVAVLVFCLVYMGGGGRAAGSSVADGGAPPAAAAAAAGAKDQGQPITIQIASAAGGGDDRYTRAPKPERHWATAPEMPTSAEMYGKLPRVPTRGLPETYQSMGVITMEDGSVLPLYGRRTAARSDRFQYYTRTDTYNPVQLPLSYKRRDCQDDVGCDELFNGETVTVSATNQKGTANIYRFDGPTYIPSVY
jgi:hypothetical protein